MDDQKVRKRVLMATVLSLLTLGLAGCSDPDDDGSGGGY